MSSADNFCKQFCRQNVFLKYFFEQVDSEKKSADDKSKKSFDNPIIAGVEDTLW